MISSMSNLGQPRLTLKRLAHPLSYVSGKKKQQSRKKKALSECSGKRDCSYLHPLWQHQRGSTNLKLFSFVGHSPLGHMPPLQFLLPLSRTLRVQVPNNHILTQNLYYNYYYPNPKYLIIGYMDPLGNTTALWLVICCAYPAG